MDLETSGAGRIGASAVSKMSWRLLPIIGLGYGCAYMDRINISFAALQMNRDLHFSASVYGLGGGLFFLSYALCGVPANLMLVRFGARRWITAIMIAWGLLAAGMALVRTPLQFYVVRILLGAAEAGFFPGVVYYLSQWFPSTYRTRAISRFYVAFPLGGAAMGLIAGPLLSLQGWLGLAGWQWLFVIEGAPALILALLLPALLPDTPMRANWLSAEERDWITGRLAEDAALAVPLTGKLLGLLREPLFWRLGLVNLCLLGATYAFTLSAPLILSGGAHLNSGQIGLLTAFASLMGAMTMIVAGWSSDRLGERYLHAILPVLGSLFAAAALASTSVPWIMIAAYVASVVFNCAFQSVYWSLPTALFAGRFAAVGVAAVNSIGMIGSFLGPIGFGLLKDRTGGYSAGLWALVVPCLIAIGLLVSLRRRALTRQTAIGHAVSAAS